MKTKQTATKTAKVAVATKRVPLAAGVQNGLDEKRHAEIVALAKANAAKTTKSSKAAKTKTAKPAKAAKAAKVPPTKAELEAKAKSREEAKAARAKARFEKYAAKKKAKYPHLVAIVPFVIDGKTCTIHCEDCDAPRRCAPQDLFQVKRCLPCQAKA